MKLTWLSVELCRTLMLATVSGKWRIHHSGNQLYSIIGNITPRIDFNTRILIVETVATRIQDPFIHWIEGFTANRDGKQLDIKESSQNEKDPL